MENQMINVEEFLGSVGSSELMLYVASIGGCDVMVAAVVVDRLHWDMGYPNGGSASV